LKIFITGANGFIGSHLVPRLAEDHQIATLDCDLLDFDQVHSSVHSFEPDVIVHLAARTEVERSFYEQNEFSQVNYVGSVNLIESARKLPNLKRFIFASTMEVYGWQPISDEIQHHGVTNRVEVFDENTAPNPNAPYAVAKYAVEKYLEYMHRTQDFPCLSIRQTNAYGRKNTDFFVMEQIIAQMLGNPAQCNLGYSTPYRNFIFIDDLIDAWMAVINSSDIPVDQPILTIGPNNAVQIQQLAQRIASRLEWTGTINWHQKPKRPGEIYWLNSGHNRITELTGWRPKIDLDTGIDLTIEMWKKIINQGNLT
jgi:nucleoside-diphosphate-sugar epimerase